MKKKIAVILVLMILLVTHFAYAENTDDELDLWYQYGVLKFDVENRILYIGSYSGELMFGSSNFDNFHVIDHDGEEITDSYYAFSNVKSVVFDIGNNPITYNVVVIDPLYQQVSGYHRFSDYSYGKKLSKIDPSLTFNELFSHLKLSDGVSYCFKDKRGKKLENLGDEKVSDYPESLYLLFDGNEYHIELDVFYDFSYNGLMANKVDGEYYFPLDKAMDTELLMRSLTAQNGNMSFSLFVDYINQTTDPYAELVSLPFTTITGDIYSAYFVPTSSHKFDKEADSNRKKHTNMRDVIKKVDEKVVSYVEKDTNRIYLHETGTSITEFIASIELEKGFSFEFFDLASQKEVYDYSLPVCSQNAMEVVLTDGFSSIPVYVYFELDVEILPTAEFYFEDHKIVSKRKNGSFGNILRDLKSDYLYESYRYNSTEVLFIIDGPYLDLFASSGIVKGVHDHYINQKYIPGANYRNGYLSVFDNREGILTRIAVTDDLSAQIKGIFKNYSVFNSLKKEVYIDVVDRMIYPYAEAIINDLDKAVVSTAKGEYISFVKVLCSDYEGDGSDYLNALKKQLRAIRILEKYNDDHSDSLKQMKKEVAKAFLLGACEMEASELTVKKVRQQKALITSIMVQLLNEDILLDRELRITFDGEIALTAEILDELRSYDIALESKDGRVVLNDEHRRLFSDGSVMTIKNDKLILSEKAN